MRIQPRIAAAFCLLSLCIGCTGLSQRIGADIERNEKRAAALLGATGRSVRNEEKAPPSPVLHDKGIWIGREAVKLPAKPLPPIFNESATFDRHLDSLTEAAERISIRTGMPVKIAPELLRMEDDAAQEPQPAKPQVTAGSVQVQERLGERHGASSDVSLATPRTPVRIKYANGTLKGLLDTVAARFGVSWKYEDGTIHFFLTETRSFQISSVPGDAALQAQVVSGAGSGGQGTPGGGSAPAGNAGGLSTNNSQNTFVATQLSVYSSIEKTVKTMLSRYGRVTASPATGSVIVTDTPASLERIAAYIESENRMLSRQVVINVTVLSVTLAESDAYGINWDLVYRTLNREYGITSRFAPATDSTLFSASIIGGSRFADSSVVIEALSRQGKVRRQTTASVVTLNNQPVPVQVAKQTGYLQSSQTNLVAQVGSTTTLTPGVVTSGFNLSILPYVLNNGTVMLQFSIDLSTLRQIRAIELDGSRIEMPEVDTRNFLQRVAMRSNETLIISGFEQTDANLDHAGVGHPRNIALGGSAKASSEKEIIVILITPSTVAGT